MMKENQMTFKFKIWWILPKIMLSWEDVQDKFNMSIFEPEFDSDRVIMQFTGYQDQSGYDLYDGDLIHCSISFCGDYEQPAMDYEIGWCEDGFVCFPRDMSGKYISLSLFDAVENYGAVLVGNKYTI